MKRERSAAALGLRTDAQKRLAKAATHGGCGATRSGPAVHWGDDAAPLLSQVTLHAQLTREGWIARSRGSRPSVLWPRLRQMQRGEHMDAGGQQKDAPLRPCSGTAWQANSHSLKVACKGGGCC